MEFIPRALVVGLFAATQPGAAPVTEEKINRIWSEVAPRQAYRQLQMAPDGSGAQFVGKTPSDGATIQLPLIQVRSNIETTAANSADEAQVTIRSIAKHLGLAQFFNLGIKLVYHAPVLTNDARGFLLNNVLRKGSDELGMLERGGPFWAGVKYGAAAADNSHYTLAIEPWLADDKFLFIDLDVQYPGAITIDDIADRAGEAAEYLSGPVKEYLDRSDGTL